MATITFQPAAGEDTYISSGQPTFNFGSSSVLQTDGDSIYRAMVRFDVPVPAGVTIVSAVVSINAAAVFAGTYTIHRALTAWHEGSSNGAAPGAGVNASTWNHRNANGSVLWSGGAGGGSGTDFSATATDTVVIPSNTFGWVDFDVLSDILGFYTGVYLNNYGWWILSDGAWLYGTSSDGSAATRPKIVITHYSAVSGSTSGTCTVTGTLSTVQPMVVLQPDASSGIDTRIQEANPTFNYGIANGLSVGAISSLKRRSLIKFDLASIPDNSHIIAATLRLYVGAEGSGTDYTVKVHRSLVAWFEGNQNGAAPLGGNDGSTWNHRNANGSVAWGAAGGQSGVDYNAVETDSRSITGTGLFFNFDVSTDVQDFVDGTESNHGWWLINLVESGGTPTNKDFYSSDWATPTVRPILQIVFQYPLESQISGTSTAAGTLEATGYLEGSAEGVTTLHAQLITNFFSVGHGQGQATVTGKLTGVGRLQGNAFGDSTAIGDIISNQPIYGTAAGTSSHVAHLKGTFDLEGLSQGIGIVIARVSSEGQMRASAHGSSTVIAVGYARAVRVAAVIGCNPVPLLYITDGSVKPNGQLNILNFLADRSGYFLVNYRPQVFQYKEGGSWSSSPQSQGRRLRSKVFDNVIDLIEVSARAGSQDALIEYQQDLIAFQEAASDYWTSDYSFLPFYLVAKAARESNTRYALIHMISCPELTNPYTQPFFDDAVGATFTSLTIRIEHGLWMSTPPGRFDCVEISGEREWTVSGWQSGS